jgi:hypothetical protein
VHTICTNAEPRTNGDPSGRPLRLSPQNSTPILAKIELEGRWREGRSCRNRGGHGMWCSGCTAAQLLLPDDSVEAALKGVRQPPEMIREWSIMRRRTIARSDTFSRPSEPAAGVSPRIRCPNAQGRPLSRVQHLSAGPNVVCRPGCSARAFPHPTTATKRRDFCLPSGITRKSARFRCHTLRQFLAASLHFRWAAHSPACSKDAVNVVLGHASMSSWRLRHIQRPGVPPTSPDLCPSSRAVYRA